METAPPTAPQDTSTAPPPPLDSGAVASLVLGIAGLLIPLANVAAIIVGAVALKRLHRPGATHRGGTIAAFGVALGGVGIVVNLVLLLATGMMIFGIRQFPEVLAGPNPAVLHRAMRNYADDTGTYPRHVAEILLVQWPSMLQLQAIELRNNGPGRLRVGDYPISRYDGTAKERRRLRDAIDALDPDAPVYRFGECWFVRFDAPIGDDRLIAGWCVNSKGAVHVALEDGGEARDLDPARWSELWRLDAAAREERGLPALPAPDFPTPALLEEADADHPADDAPE